MLFIAHVCMSFIVHLRALLKTVAKIMNFIKKSLKDCKLSNGFYGYLTSGEMPRFVPYVPVCPPCSDFVQHVPGFVQHALKGQKLLAQGNALGNPGYKQVAL